MDMRIIVYINTYININMSLKIRIKLSITCPPLASAIKGKVFWYPKSLFFRSWFDFGHSLLKWMWVKRMSCPKIVKKWKRNVFSCYHLPKTNAANPTRILWLRKVTSQRTFSYEIFPFWQKEKVSGGPHLSLGRLINFWIIIFIYLR